MRGSYINTGNLSPISSDTLPTTDHRPYNTGSVLSTGMLKDSSSSSSNSNNNNNNNNNV